MSNEFKTGFIGIVGPTNSGKSTLMNALIGQKVSIVSPKVQTTYHGVRGIRSTKEEQMVFTDTPGFQRHKESVARLLNKVAERHAKDCDVLVWVFDASNPRVLLQIQKMREKILALKPKEKTFLVLNKVDKVAKPSLLPIMEAVIKLDLFHEIIPMSARKKDGLENLLKAVRPELSTGEKLFPDDDITDRPAQFLVSELVREKIYRATNQEVPYSVWVEIEEWEKEAKCPTIRAVIHVDSDSKKPILIGKKGEMLKRVGTEARREIEALLGHQVCLKLHVDVEKGWKTDSRRVEEYLELH